MLFDSHVHFGQFNDRYYTPPQVLKTLDCIGVTRFAYSSTSAVVTDDPVFMREERVAMKELSKNRAIPLLWVTHSMLTKSKDLTLFLDDEIRGLKIHGVSEKWNPEGKSLQRVFSIARDRKIAVKLHTGEKEKCYAGMYKKICQQFDNVRVLLAHGRPLEQTIDVLKNCSNAFVDTAFMPHDHLKLLLKEGFANQIVFGSDTPIPSLFLKSSLTGHLRSRIDMSMKISGADWSKISWKNANRLFGIVG